MKLTGFPHLTGFLNDFDSYIIGGDFLCSESQ